MKLTDELKNNVEAVETNEEKKAIIEKARVKLTEEELEMVAGGRFVLRDNDRRW